MLIYLQSIEEYLEDYDRRRNEILNKYNKNLNDENEDKDINKIEYLFDNIIGLIKILDVLL